MEQETLIYIDDRQKYDASAAANTFTNNNVKNRVYINTLGAELGMKYLNSENVDTSGLKNMHSIKKIIEEFDIADIMLKGIHIDVRVVFDENAIFIPKSHFEYNILPDIYLVFKIENEYSRVRFLGFFEPKLINKNNANSDYYFIEKEKLAPALDLLKYIESHKSADDTRFSVNDVEKTENLIIAMADNDISENDKKYLLEQLTKSAELRDKFIEYETFETLSYKAMTDPSVDKHSIAKDITPLDEFEIFEDAQVVDNTDIVPEAIEVNEDFINTDTTESGIENIQDIESVTENLDLIETAEQEISADNLEEGLFLDDNVESQDENIDVPQDIEVAEQEISADNLEEGLFLDDNIESQDENIDVPQGSENSDGLDIDSAIETLGTVASAAATTAAVAAGAEAVSESIVDNTSANAQDFIANASDLAEDLVDLASDNAENIINDSQQKDNSMLTDDAISIDSVNVENEIEEFSENNFEKVDLPADNKIENNNFDVSELQGNILEEAVSLESVIPEDTSFEEEKMPEGTIALENIDVPDLPDEDEDFQLDLDDENSYLDTISETADTNMEDSISLEDIDDSHVGGADNMDTFVSVADEDTDDLIIDSDEPYTETFGKNLMENLVDNEKDGILIDGIDNITEETPVEEQPAVDDFLTQIDDVIDTALLSEEPVELNNIQDDASLDLLDSIAEDSNSTETENIKSDDTDLETADMQQDNLLLEEPIQADELPIETLENNETIEALDSLEVLASQTPEDTVNLIDADILTSELPEVSDTISQERRTEQAIEALVEQEQEQEQVMLGESTDVQTDVPQDYIEDLLDNDNSVNKDSHEAEENDLNILYTEAEGTSSETEQPAFDDIDEIEEIESDADASDSIPGAAIINQKKQQSNNSKILILAAVMVGLLAAATAFYFVKPKDNNADFEPLPNNSKTTLADNSTKDTDTSSAIKETPSNSMKTKAESENKTTENVLKTNAPDITKSATENKKTVVKELKITQPQKPISSTAYMSVSKLVWDVPDNLSYSTRMQNYLRTTGKSIKLTLSTDLLLATEYAYANSVKVGITIGKDGSVQSAKILTSSGSSQIDNIVLQSVKETLNAIKPPSEDVKGKEFNLNLIIYF